ncbi:MAG: IS1096 element passenger TnpR family protein [Actinomycetota bacterium]
MARPEDCGGYPGYYDLVEAMADTAHPRDDELREWVGGEFDPAAVDADQISAASRVGQDAQRR